MPCRQLCLFENVHGFKQRSMEQICSNAEAAPELGMHQRPCAPLLSRGMNSLFRKLMRVQAMQTVSSNVPQEDRMDNSRFCAAHSHSASLLDLTDSAYLHPAPHCMCI